MLLKLIVEVYIEIEFYFCKHFEIEKYVGIFYIL